MSAEQSPIAALDLAIVALAGKIAGCPDMPAGTLSRTVDRIAELTAQRGELIRQETSEWRAWSKGS